MEEEKKSVKKVVLDVGVIVFVVVLAITLAFLKSDKNMKTIQKTTILSPSGEELVNDLSMTSDNRQIVINLSNACWMIYRFKGDKVSNLTYYYRYESEQAAKEFFKNYQEGKQEISLAREEVQEAKQVGRFVVVSPISSVYENTTRQGVEQTYAILQDIYGKRAENAN